MEVESGETRARTQQGRWDEEQGEDGSDEDDAGESGDEESVSLEGVKDFVCDLSLLAAQEEVMHAHRMVLSLRSEPMRAMLRSGESCACWLIEVWSQGMMKAGDG